MKALSIKQPWAWAIIHGGKDIENRLWKSDFRGRFLVHASKSFDMEGYQFMQENQRRLGIERLPQLSDKAFPMGGIIGSVEMIACCSYHGSPWFFGPYGFRLTDPKPMEFRPCRGMLGFFEVTIDHGIDVK